jgi:hypothetical protein
MAEHTDSILRTRFRAKAMKTLRIACAAGLCLAGAGIPAAHASDQEYADAVRHFRDGRLADAYGHFRVLASRGDADAARIALFMSKFGPVLYGHDWDEAPHVATAWEALAKDGKKRQDAPIVTYLNPQPAAKVAAQ